MSYQLGSLLKKCNNADVEFIINTLHSYINFADNKILQQMFDDWDSALPMSDEFAQKLETEIRYCASSDIAYAYRKVKGEVPAGIDVDEIMHDIAKVQKIKIKPIGSYEGKIESLTGALVEKKFLSLTQEEQADYLKKLNISEAKIDEIIKGMKKNPLRLFPILAAVLGEKATLELVQGLIVTILGSFLGKEAAKKILVELAKRLPGQSLGLIMWAISLGWLGVDLCGPAFRKTIPVMLYLGMVAFRDGPENPESFFAEETPDESTEEI